MQHMTIAEQGRSLRRAMERDQANMVLLLLERAHRKAPELRLGQVLANALAINNDELWEISDSALEWRLRALIAHLDE